MKKRKSGLRVLAVMALVLCSLGLAAPRAWAAADDAFAVIDTEGNETTYAKRTDAQNAMKDGYTFKLLKDYTGDWGIKPNVKARDITVDLNGFSITCTTAKAGRYALSVGTGYGVDRDCTVTIKNGGAKQAVLTSAGPQIEAKSGDSRYALTVKVEGDIAFKSLTEGEAPIGIALGTAAKLTDTPSARSLISNGVFSVKEDDGSGYLYGSYANAAVNSADGMVTMVKDYAGSDAIISGSKTSTLDLAGHSYTYTGKKAAVEVNHPNVSLAIENGSIAAADPAADGALLVGAPTAGQMNNRGLVLDGVKMSVSGADRCGIVTNGTETGNTVELKNSTLDVPSGYGIYFPSAGRVAIESSTINAKHVGVQMCAGSLAVTGGSSIVVTGAPQQKTEDDGPIADGAAVSVVKREGYQDIDSALIESGSFTSVAGVDAVKAYAFDNADKVEAPWTDSAHVVRANGGTYSDASVLAFAGDKVALKTDEGFTLMPEKQALESGAVSSVTLDNGSLVYFVSNTDAKDFVEAEGTLGAESIKPVTYTVSFDANGGGSNPSSQTVDASKTAKAPKDPVREGYAFVGWFADGANAPYDFNTPVMSNVKLSARWVKTWTVTFVNGNGTEDVVTVVRDGEAVARPADPALKGWEFVGWFTVKNADGSFDVNSAYDFSQAVSADMTLYGGWVKKVAPGQQPEPKPEPGKPAPQKKPALPQTGDASALPMAAAALSGVAAIGAAASRRRKAE